ncbi:MFS transporter [Neobacillus sp. PS3-40]|uniref:MFS transporter n=1 Tax=Neobacillus sp. PS3-40 TaxID=3070679 RepID=UPI0027DF78B1|nr:MFS transporter [Neobacillus sp. PS3-40]WML44171.1 MFS transporter [Neobacillus sp. PS3-40]
MKKNRALFLTAIASGTMLNPLNSSMISLALHSIQKDFHLSFSTVSWLISSFYLASAVAQPVTGKIGDLIGSKKTFLIGLVLVAISAIGAPLSTSFMMLLIMRLFQSIGSSAIYPSGMSLIRDHIHERQASALAVLSIFASAMTSLGPTLGGFLIVWGDWPAIFKVNFPFILISFLLGWYVFPKDQKKKGVKLTSLLTHMDLIGIGLFAIGIVLLLWFLLSIETKVHFVAGITGVVFLVVFVWWELREKEPFIDIRLFKTHPKLSWVYLQFIFLNIFFYCLFFGLPSYFQDEMHLSVRTTGLLMLFMSGVSIFISPLTGKWIDKSGVKQPIIIGSFLSIIGAVSLSLFFVHAPYWGMGLILSLMGISYGIGNVVLQSAMLMESPPSIIGTTSGLFQTCRYLGSIISSIVLGLVFGKEITAQHLQILGIVLIVTGSISFLMSLFFTKAIGKRMKIGNT